MSNSPQASKCISTFTPCAISNTHINFSFIGLLVRCKALLHYVPFSNTHKDISFIGLLFLQVIPIHGDPDYYCINFQNIFYCIVLEKIKGKFTPCPICKHS